MKLLKFKFKNKSKREKQKTDVWPDKKDSIQSSEKIKMQEYTEFRKKESRIFSNFKLMAQKKSKIIQK